MWKNARGVGADGRGRSLSHLTEFLCEADNSDCLPCSSDPETFAYAAESDDYLFMYISTWLRERMKKGQMERRFFRNFCKFAKNFITLKMFKMGFHQRNVEQLFDAKMFLLVVMSRNFWQLRKLSVSN